MPALRSSNLSFADYDPASETLTIGFRSGSTYAYEGVDEATYEGLLAAPSAGAYFAAVIRDGYPSRRVG